MVYSSKYGREVVWTVLIVILGLSKKQPHRRAAFYLVLSVAAMLALGDVSKFLLLRNRPFVVLPNAHYLLPPSTDSSFPSGHTLIVCGCATVVWFTLRKRLALAATLEAALVSFSRIYVGEHFPLDVIGGVFFGMAVGAGVMVFQHRLDGSFRRLDRFWQAKIMRRETEDSVKEEQRKEETRVA
jgi:undecaprenyl-diphosphatase